MAFENDKKITMDVAVNAPVEKAWEVWTHPEHIVHWNFASDDWQCPAATNDVSEGGHLSWRMEAKDGSVGFDFEGTYRTVKPKALLEYELGDGRPVKVSFRSADNHTVVTETFQGEDEHTLEMQKQGWQAILNNYKVYCEGI